MVSYFSKQPEFVYRKIQCMSKSMCHTRNQMFQWHRKSDYSYLELSLLFIRGLHVQKQTNKKLKLEFHPSNVLQCLILGWTGKKLRYCKIPEDDSKPIPNKAKNICATIIHIDDEEQHIYVVLHTASKPPSQTGIKLCIQNTPN